MQTRIQVFSLSLVFQTIFALTQASQAILCAPDDAILTPMEKASKKKNDDYNYTDKTKNYIPLTFQNSTDCVFDATLLFFPFAVLRHYKQ